MFMERDLEGGGQTYERHEVLRTIFEAYIPAKCFNLYKAMLSETTN
jgi:hypothetical protein